MSALVGCISLVSDAAFAAAVRRHAFNPTGPTSWQNVGTALTMTRTRAPGTYYWPFDCGERPALRATLSKAAFGGRVEGWQVRADGMDADSATWWSFTVSGFEPEESLFGGGPSVGGIEAVLSEAARHGAPPPPPGPSAGPVPVPAGPSWLSPAPALPPADVEASPGGPAWLPAIARSLAADPPADPHPPTPLLVEYYHTDAPGSPASAAHRERARSYGEASP